jgi:hypothetical protein
VTTGDEADRTGASARLGRVVYESACAAAGIDPVRDQHVERRTGSGIYTVPEYTVDHILWNRLLALRVAGLCHERAVTEARALDTHPRPDSRWIRLHPRRLRARLRPGRGVGPRAH